MNETIMDMPSVPKRSLVTTWVVLALIVGVCGGGALVYFASPYFVKQAQAPIVATSPESPTPSNIAPIELVPANNTAPLAVNWLKTPEKLGDLNILKTEASSTPENTYYRVGTSEKGDIIIGTPGALGPGYQPYGFFIKSGEKYTYIVKGSVSAWDSTDPTSVAQNDLALMPGVATDTTTELSRTAFPPSIVYKGVALLLSGKPEGELSVEENTNITRTKLQDLDAGGTLYTENYAEEPGGKYSLQQLTLELPGFIKTYYGIKTPFIKDDGSLSVVWTNGSKYTEAYRTDGVGSCGSPDARAVLSTNPTDNELTVVGKASTGETIYAFKDLNNATLKFFYSRSAAKSGDNGVAKMSIKEFNDKHGLVLFQDTIGRSVLLSNQNYGPQAECGKPVIYLYPKEKTNVSVSVDATIRKSEPEYNGGWNVTAYPDGTIESNGTQYPYLYWDGIGKWYPMLDEGVIVPRADVEPTLRKQMTQLGLNSKEQNDFLEFWMGHMPADPFVRLTWFDTRLMDRIAPLSISPKPDSMLRVFLDFEGLKAPYSIRPQVFSKPHRDGFTVVEWGGLLRGE